MKPLHSSVAAPGNDDAEKYKNQNKVPGNKEGIHSGKWKHVFAMQRKKRFDLRQIGTSEIQNGGAGGACKRNLCQGESLGCLTISKSGSGARCALRRRILRERESQDPFGLDRVRRAGDIVKRAGAESPHVGVPIGQVRKHDHRGAAGRGSQNAHRGAEIAIRQIVAAQDKLKRCSSMRARASVREAQRTDCNPMRRAISSVFSH